MPEIVLASTSPYRRKQLEDIGLSVRGVAPIADENTIGADGLSPREVAEKRAQLKTSSISALPEFFDAIVIGGDQLVHLDGEILGKPGTVDQAVAQLLKMSGRQHELITACEIHWQGKVYRHIDVTKMHMRSLTEKEALAYVKKDQPLNCAGAYKIESSGLWLFERIDTSDHTAITGLPLLFVTDTLWNLGESGF
jgi:septum formation protein